jgi:mono/diheme cytochrome c family protein
MKSQVAIAVTVLALVAGVKPLSAQEQKASTSAMPQFVVDKKLADTGKGLFTAKGCIGCHTIGKGRLAAPDLNGLLDRRSPEWIKKWLHDPEVMLASDPTAQGLLKEYNNLRMPNLKLTDDEILALMNYIASQSKVKK